MNDYEYAVQGTTRELYRLKEENARLRAALEQYADHENWMLDAYECLLSQWRPNEDGWTLAQETLDDANGGHDER